MNKKISKSRKNEIERVFQMLNIASEEERKRFTELARLGDDNNRKQPVFIESGNTSDTLWEQVNA